MTNDIVTLKMTTPKSNAFGATCNLQKQNTKKVLSATDNIETIDHALSMDIDNPYTSVCKRILLRKADGFISPAHCEFARADR